MQPNQGYTRRWEPRRQGRSAGDAARTSYYGLPVVKAPHWDWKIVLYFFFGGISSGSALIACVAGLLGGRTNRTIERIGRYLSLVTLVPSPILLIWDLGRPERFHHMLRVLKLRSAMSVGTWGLSAFGMVTGLSACIQAAQDGLFDWFPFARRALLALPRAPLNLAGACFGCFVGGYTGVLLGITAIPIWAKNRLLLGPLFLCSAVASASAAIGLVVSLLRGGQQPSLRRIERIDTIAQIAELGLLLAASTNLGQTIGKPLRQGRLARLFGWGTIGTGVVAPLLVRTVLGPKAPRGTAIVSSLCTLAGGYCLRHVMVYAGIASAADPQATFEWTRRREV